MPEQDARMRIDIGVRICNLAVLLEDAGHDLIDGINDLEKLIIRQVLQSKFSLASVTRIGLTEDSVAVPRNDLLRVESIPSKFGNSLGIHLLTLGGELIGQLLNPLEHLLVGKTVERAGESVQPGSIREVGIGQSRADKMSGMGRGITTLVVRVDAQVQAHQLIERRVVITEHSAEVTGIIKGGILGNYAIEVGVAVNGGGNLG
mmetsp:Transcript_36347/g.79542  ORF Transcript_36347/g.79542 Transcript_36347/m.79542 type:complete len:204 (-) Transcript_36347:666-1277(-)